MHSTNIKRNDGSVCVSIHVVAVELHVVDKELFGFCSQGMNMIMISNTNVYKKRNQSMNGSRCLSLFASTDANSITFFFIILRSSSTTVPSLRRLTGDNVQASTNGESAVKGPLDGTSDGERGRVSE